MATNMIGKVRRVRKVDPNGNIYYDRGVSDVIFDPVRGVSVKKDIDDLRAGMLTALQYVAANPKGLDGKSAYDIAVEYGFNGSEQDWVLSLKGEPGKDGLSAYEIAVINHGFVGTEEEWLDSLRNKEKVINVYDMAVERGYTGTEDDFYKSLIIEPISTSEIQGMYNSIVSSQEGGG